MNLSETPHRRQNPLTGDWILVSPHRTKRPWLGKQETTAPSSRPEYDPQCYLCPGNHRAEGTRNPGYEGTFIFTNDFSAMLPDSDDPADAGSPLLRMASVKGTCRVICFSPRHDLTLPEMPLETIEEVIDAWAAQIEELGQTYRWVQIFENKGEVMGASNPHPHGQVWASTSLPEIPEREDRHQREYYHERGSALLIDYLKLELEQRERLVVENDEWIVVVPFWAVWPFETLLLPRRPVQRLPEINRFERKGLADILKRLLTRYDNLFEIDFPYSMGWHGAPTCGHQDTGHWQLHAHFYPPLLRSATIKKFMVGYEMMAEAQRDLTPEQAAQRLRDLSEVHFKDKLTS